MSEIFEGLWEQMKKKVWNGRMNHRKFVIFALEKASLDLDFL